MGALTDDDQGNQDRSVPTLAQLITERKAEIGLSYEELAAKADYVLTRQRFQQLGKGLRITEFPEPATLEGVAIALDVDLAFVVLAAAKSIGMPVTMGSQSDLARMLPAGANRLTRSQRNALLALIRSIVAPDASRPVGRDVPADDTEDSRGVPTRWLPAEEPGVRRDENGDERHQLGSA